jgi:hypothetical protein
LGAGWIQVVKFDQAGMLSDVVWVRVPSEVVFEDCQRAKPLPMVMEGVIGLSPALAEGWKQKAIDDCVDRQHGERRIQENQERVFREDLRVASRVIPRANVTTRIVPVIQWLAHGPRTVALDVVTDGIDHSGTPLASLKIPKRVRINMVLTRPNPKRSIPSLDDVLSAARRWSEVPGITVVGAGGYAELVSSPGEGAP